MSEPVLFLDPDISLVIFRFAFSNPKYVPKCIRKEEADKDSASSGRTIKGRSLIDSPVHNVGILHCLSDIQASGYELADAKRKENKRAQGCSSQIVQFVFVRTQCAHVCEEFVQTRGIIIEAFEKMCREALWRVRLFLNPLFEEHELVEGKFTASINLEARTPLIEGDGSSVMIWPKDSTGKSVKAGKKILRQPECFLRVLEGGFYFQGPDLDLGDVEDA